MTGFKIVKGLYFFHRYYNIGCFGQNYRQVFMKGSITLINEELVNYCETTEPIYGLLDIFKMYFFKEYKRLKAKERDSIIKALPYMFRMWYYSTLIDETPFSPANIINSQIREVFGEGSTIAAKPILIYKNKVLKDIQFEYIVFSYGCYPVLMDLKIFLEHCTPDIETDESGLLSEKDSSLLLPSLCFNESFYITYLTNICYELKLLKRMPSIGVHRAMTLSDNIKNFFMLPSKEQMKKLIEATISLASSTLLRLLPSDKKLFSKEALNKLFTSSCSLDDYVSPIIKRHKINIDLENLDLENLDSIKELNFSEEDIYSTAINLELSFVFDAYLATPLGHYLQCIQPLYLDCFNFKLFLIQLLQGDNLDIPTIKLYFAMNNLYDLTYTGKKLMSAGQKKKDDIQRLRNSPDYDIIYAAILQYHSEEIDLFEAGL